MKKRRRRISRPWYTKLFGSRRKKLFRIRPKTKAKLACGIMAAVLVFLAIFLITGPKGHKGIDVSHHQGNIDWTAVAATGEVEYVFIKATEGSSLVDNKYRTNLRKARQQGILVGAYHFFSTASTGQNQFAHFKSIVGKDIDLLPVLDLEPGGGRISSDEKYQQQVKAFIDACFDYYGRYPIVYASPSFVKDHHLKKTIEKCPYWMAWYTRMPQEVTSRRNYVLLMHPASHAIMWQYTEKGSVEGIVGNVDLNECWEMASIKFRY